MSMKATSGKDFARPVFEAASDDSSSLNRKSMSLNTEAWKEKWRTEPDTRADLLAGISFCTVETVMTVTAAEMTKEERRELRKKLRQELDQVKGLSSKLEARELQLRRQAQPAGVYPSLSDAQFSGNDVRNGGGKEVTSQLALTSPGTSQRDIDLFKQRGFTANDGTPIGAEFSHNKRTPKANQLYHNSEFVMGDKMTPPAKPRPKPGTGSKRGAATRVDGGDRKRKLVGVPSKQNVELMIQCKNILKKLMGHKDGWVFNEPVDAVKLGLSDYHLVIQKPMDLGTIKAKLERKDYSSPLEFADDVRLTFLNAMNYNPRGNDVHQMADELRQLFEENWKVINEKLEEEKIDGEGELEVLNQHISQQPEIPQTFLDQSQSKPKKKKTPVSKNPTPPKPKAATKPKAPAKPKATPKPKATIKPKPKSKPKREMNYQEKAKLSGSLQLLPPHKLEHIIRLMKERNPNMSQKDDEIEVDIDSFDNETLWELDRFVKNCLKNVGKSKKAAGQQQSGVRNQPMVDRAGQNPSKKRKGEPRDEDVDIGDDIPNSSFPPVVIDKDAGHASRSSSSGSSSSESGSSSDSDSGSSSASESDADDNRSADKRR